MAEPATLLQTKKKMKVQEPLREQDENENNNEPELSESVTISNKTESNQDENQGEQKCEENAADMGEEIVLFDYASIGARPKDRSVCARHMIPIKPKTLEEDERENRLSRNLCKQVIVEEDEVEESNNSSDAEEVAKLILPYTDDSNHLLCEKYKKLYQECRMREIDQVRLNQLQIQYEQLNMDYRKALHSKIKLENLCKILQNQSKEMKESMSKKLYDEEKRRKELAGRFQESFEELSKMMEMNNVERFKLHEDNVDLTKRIQMFREDIIKAETQTAKFRREIELQKQLNDSKITKIRLQSIIEKQKLEHDVKVLQLNLAKRDEAFLQFEEKIKILQEENQFYTRKIEKYEEALKQDAYQSAKIVDQLISMSIGAATKSGKDEYDGGETAEAEMLVDKAEEKGKVVKESEI